MVEIDIKVKNDEGEYINQTLQYQPMAEINLAKAIGNNGWTVKRLAERLGCKEPAIRQMITGKPSLPTIYKMAWAMDIDPRELFFPVDKDGNVIEEQKEEPKTEEKTDATAKVGMIMCPHCHCGFEITGVVTPPTK